jgi:hypothetical protein
MMVRNHQNFEFLNEQQRWKKQWENQRNKKKQNESNTKKKNRFALFVLLINIGTDNLSEHIPAVSPVIDPCKGDGDNEEPPLLLDNTGEPPESDEATSVDFGLAVLDMYEGDY